MLAMMEEEHVVAGLNGMLNGSLIRGATEKQSVWILLHGLGGTRDDRVPSALAAALYRNGIGSYRPDLPPSMSLASDVHHVQKLLEEFSSKGFKVKGY